MISVKDVDHETLAKAISIITLVTLASRAREITTALTHKFGRALLYLHNIVTGPQHANSSLFRQEE